MNLAQDRHNECKNMLQRSQTGFYFVACSKDQKDGKDKEVQSDDNTKLEHLAQMIQAKSNSVKIDDVKINLKCKI